MKTFGRLYADKLKYPETFGFFPIVDKGWTHETEEPYRRGTCLVLRFPYTTPGLILGIWGKASNLDEEDALLRALGAREVELEDIDLGYL